MMILQRARWTRQQLATVTVACYKGYHSHGNKQRSSSTVVTGLAFAAGFFGMVAMSNKSQISFAEDNVHRFTSMEKIFKRKEVEKHRSLEDGVWVTYRGGVYDITNYLKSHPGGNEKLMMAAGEDLELFWKLIPFQQHYQSPMVFQLLEEMKIGSLDSEDVVDVTENDWEERVRKYPVDDFYDCIIIGAGMSGLQAAHTLIRKQGIDAKKVLVLEAHDYIGGRVRQIPDFIKGVNVELGGEFLHGSNTALTEFAAAHKEPLSQMFVWAAGDGGPLEAPVDGGYGLYYFKERGLLRFDSKNKEFVRMNQILWDLCFLDVDSYTDDMSLYDYLKSQGFSEEMMRYAEAGFANTLCANAKGLSLKQCIQWQKLWHEEVTLYIMIIFYTHTCILRRDNNNMFRIL